MIDAQDGEIVIEVAHRKVEVDAEALRRLLQSTAAGEGRRIASLTVVLTDHAHVRDLNRTYLEHDYVTDVLSFSLGDEAESSIDGEIYVDLDTAKERHAEFGATVEEEVFRYAVHGLLHLIGYTDVSPAEEQRMHELEDLYLAGRNP